MKKLAVLFAVLVMVFAFTIPAAAGGLDRGGCMGSASTCTGTGQGQQGFPGMFVIVGKISDLGTNSVTIDVLRGNKLGQSAIGTQLTVTVTPQTLFLIRNGTTISLIGFADLQVGQQVNVNGTVVDNVWTVYRITVGALLSCIPL
jgi:hypothetical protein